MVKRQLVCNVFHNIKSDDFYIGTASAIYCATGFPLPLNRSDQPQPKIELKLKGKGKNHE